MVHRLLTTIFDAEARNDWQAVFPLYKELYTRSSSREVTIHFAFFCWHLLWQWDEIVFPGETLSAEERMAADERCGISRSELLMYLDKTTRRMLNAADDTPTRYLVILIHMQRIYPYFFDKETFSDEIRDRLFRYLELRPPEDRGTEILFAYQKNQDQSALTPEDRQAIREMFPEQSLMHRYFCWLFSCWELETPLGTLQAEVDGKPVYYAVRQIPLDHSCSHLEGRYAVTVRRIPDGQPHTVALRIRKDRPFAHTEENGGENLELQSFFRDGVKLSVGVEGDSCVENGVRCGAYDYDTAAVEDGMSIRTLPQTRTRIFCFGVAWLHPEDAAQEIETWFGADPTLY